MKYDTTLENINQQYTDIQPYEVNESMFPIQFDILDQEICDDKEIYGNFTPQGADDKTYPLKCKSDG